MGVNSITCHPQTVRDEAVRLYHAGMRTEEIATQIRVPVNTTYRFLREAGIDTSKKRRRPNAQLGGHCIHWRNRKNGEEIDAAIRTDYPSLGPVPLAERFGLTKGIISKRAWQLGIKCTGFAARRAATIVAKNVSLTPGYFEQWSPNMAWLLGYIWTDGAISWPDPPFRLHFRCAETDEHIIHEIKQELQATGVIQRFAPTVVKGRYVGQAQVGLSVNSFTAVKTLVEIHGIPQNKSNLDPLMPSVPDKFFQHFARGVVDGDGSICLCEGNRRPQIAVYGSNRFLDEFRTCVATFAGVRAPVLHQHGTSNKLFRIGWAAAVEVLQIIRWLYPAGEYLELKRKRAVAEQSKILLAERIREGRYRPVLPPAGNASDVVGFAAVARDELHPLT